MAASQAPVAARLSARKVRATESSGETVITCSSIWRAAAYRPRRNCSRASVTVCAPAAKAMAAASRHLVTGIIQHQIEIAEAVSRFSFKQAKAEQGRRSWRDGRKHIQTAGGWLRDLHHLAGG